jgi:hypothetical protein
MKDVDCDGELPTFSAQDIGNKKEEWEEMME